MSLPVSFLNFWIGWMVFDQAKLIFTLICLMKLTSKREGNCNVMIIRPADHGLYMIQSRKFNHHPSCTELVSFIFSSSNLPYLNLIFLTTTRSSFLYCFIFVTTSSPLYQLGYQLALAPFREKVLRIAYELNKQFALIFGLREKTICRPTFFKIW